MNDQQEQLDKLKFRAPALPPGPVPAIVPNATTNILGFFNPNPWPVHIAISELNITIQLDQRGEYVVDRVNNVKINDPILNRYVGPNQLSRETSATQVPIRYFPRPGVARPGSGHVVQEASGFKDTVHGAVPVSMINVQPQTAAPFGNSSSIAGFTMEEARALGLVKPTYEPPESQVIDSTGTPIQGEHLMTLDEATPRDMKPGEYRRWLAAKQAKQSAALGAPAPLKVPEGLAPPPTPIVPAAAVAETKQQQLIQESLLTAAKDETVMTDAVEAALRTPRSPVTPVDITENLPPPVLPGDQPGPTPVQPRFICLVDGRGFDFRSQLSGYAKRKYPDRVAEIMASYPLPPLPGRP